MPSEPEQRLETGVTQPASDQAIDDETCPFKDDEVSKFDIVEESKIS